MKEATKIKLCPRGAIVRKPYLATYLWSGCEGMPKDQLFGGETDKFYARALLLLLCFVHRCLRTEFSRLLGLEKQGSGVRAKSYL